MKDHLKYFKMEDDTKNFLKVNYGTQKNPKAIQNGRLF